MSSDPADPGDDLSEAVWYHGRLWDAPFMDGARKLDHLVVSGAHCEICDEPMIDQVDDVVLFPRLTCHLECFLRSIVGSVAHLQKQCWCYGVESPIEPAETYREGAKKVLEHLLKSGSRFKNVA